MRVRALSVFVCVLWVGLVGILRDPATAQQPTPLQPGAAPGAPLPAQEPQTVSAATLTTPPEITIQDTPAGSLFADKGGFTLYVTDRDREPNKSTCSGPCAEQWVPLRSEGDAKPFGEWTLVARDDGKPQWAYKGRPLYRYRWEAKPRWAEAHNEVWRYAAVVHFPAVSEGRRGYTPPPSSAKVSLPPSPGSITGNPTSFGIVFSDSKNLTLYSHAGTSPCSGECLEAWIPVAAPQAALPIGDWTIVTGVGGMKQWAYQGRPVYRSIKDTKPGDANGAGDSWKPVLVPSLDMLPAAAPSPRPTSPMPRKAATAAPR